MKIICTRAEQNKIFEEFHCDGICSNCNALESCALADAEWTITRWRAKEGGRYWCVNAAGMICYDEENRLETDKRRYDYGNYYRTEAEAKAARDLIAEIHSRA